MDRSPASVINDINHFKDKYPEVRLIDPITPEVIDEIDFSRSGSYSSNDSAEKYQTSKHSHDETYGTWFYFPWRSEAVRFPDEDDFYNLRTSRNRLMLTSSEQQILREKIIAIAGLSVGSSVVAKSVQLGIGREVLATDPDIISATNLNRIDASFDDVGRKKTEWFGRKLAFSDPYVNQMFSADGYNLELEKEWDLKQPDLVIEEVDNLAIKALMRRFAMIHRVPLITVGDFGENSVVDIERHDVEDVKPFNGRLSTGEFEALVNGELSKKQEEKIKVKIVGYSNISPRLVESAMDPDLDGLPQLGTTVGIGASMGAAAIAGIFLGRTNSSGRSRVIQSKVLGLKSQESLLSAMNTWLKFAKRMKS